MKKGGGRKRLTEVYPQLIENLAASEGHTEVIQTLLDSDRSLAKEKDNDGWTALDFAIRQTSTSYSARFGAVPLSQIQALYFTGNEHKAYFNSQFQQNRLP